MSRPPTPLRWPDLREPAAPDVRDQLAAQWQAIGVTLGHALNAVYARLDALEAQAHETAIEAEYLTPKAAALKFGLSPRTIHRWCAENRVASIGQGNGRRVKIADVATLARYRAGGR